MSTSEVVTCLWPATMVTSPWSVLQPEEQREEVDEPSYAERPLTLFRRPPVPPPELRRPPRLLRPRFLLWRRHDPPPYPTRVIRLPHRCRHRNGCGGGDPHQYRLLPSLTAATPRATTSAGAVFAVATVALPPFLPVALLQRLLRDWPDYEVGGLNVVMRRAFTKENVGARLICAEKDS